MQLREKAAAFRVIDTHAAPAPAISRALVGKNAKKNLIRLDRIAGER